MIADDHLVFRDGLRGLLEAHDVEIVGEASNGREAVNQARRLSPDVVLMDLDMPDLNGLAATRLISAESPAVKVVILTASEEDANLFAEFLRPVQAPTPRPPDEPTSGLTERERDVLDLRVQGIVSNRELAERLVVSLRLNQADGP